MNQQRLARVLRNMERDGLEQIVVTSTASVYYLTGYWVEPMERMLALYLRADGTCALFANTLFALEPQEGLELVLHQDSDEPTAALAAALRPGRLGVDKAWPSKFLIALLNARPDVTPVLGSAPVTTPGSTRTPTRSPPCAMPPGSTTRWWSRSSPP